MPELAELLDRFSQSPAVLAAALEGVAEDESKFSPAPGKWSVREIARHLADVEILAGVRLRQIIAEDRPTLPMLNQDQWAAHLHYNDSDPHDSLRDFAALRAVNSAMLSRLPEAALDREGLHATRGVTTLRFWIIFLATHTENHAQQIRHARAAWSQRAL